MSKMAIMPHDDYAGVCEAVRAKHGTTDTIKSGELKGLIESIPQDVTYSGKDLFISLVERTISGDVTAEMLDGVTTLGIASFQNTPITSVVMPDSVITVAGSVFTSCYSLKSATFGANVDEVYAYVFNGCGELKQVIFKSTPAMLHESALVGCPNLTDIYVPWAEGEVANAPWGAPDTCAIHYNTQTT